MPRFLTFRLLRQLLAVVVLAAPGAHAQTPAWPWVLNPAVSNGGVVNSVTTTDAAGNVYLAGYFIGAVTFGATTLTAPLGSGAGFVVKLTGGGTVLWTAQADGLSEVSCRAITVDAAGAVYVTGFFQDNTTFGATTLTSQGRRDVFVAKLSPAGAWQWAVAGGGAESDFGRAIAIDGAGDVYVAGAFFSPAATFGSTTLPNGSTQLTYNAFVAKLSAAGAWQWAKGGTVSGSGNIEVNALAARPGGGVYVGGVGNAPAAISLAAFTSTTARGFVGTFSATGTWGAQITTGGAGTSSVTALAADAGGTVYVAGSFGSFGTPTTVTFGATSLTPAGGVNLDAFVARLSPMGTWQWAKAAGGPDFDFANGLALGATGAVLVKGFFASSDATFGATTLINSHAPMVGPSDTFVAQLTPAGAWQWAVGCVGDLTNDGGLAPAGPNQAVITGSFQGPTAVLGPVTLTNVGAAGKGMYLAQLDAGPLGLAAEDAAGNATRPLYPNPARDVVYLTATPGATSRLLDPLGRVVLTAALPAGAATLDVRALPAGLYWLTLVEPGGRCRTQRVVKE